MTAQQVQPDLAIVFKDHRRMISISVPVLPRMLKERCADSPHGQQLHFQRGILRFAQETGDLLNQVPGCSAPGRQHKCRKNQPHGKGGPGTVLGIPSRYVHSHYNFCAEEDVDATVRMAVEVIRTG